MKKLVLFFLFLCFITPLSYSQLKINVDASVKNTLRYGSGYEYSGPNKISKEYFEDWADARIKIKDIVFGFRYEVSDPIEYGLNFKGIRKRFIEYNNDIGVSLRAGDFWETVSHGLSLNVFEDRTIVYDTGIDGIRLTYKNTFGKKNPVKLKAQIIGGDLTYSDNIIPSRIEKYKIRNVNFEFSPVKPLTIGGGYVYSEGNIPSGENSTDIKADIPEVNLNFNYKSIQFYSAYVHKNVRTVPNTSYPVAISAPGDALYSSLSLNKGAWGITLEYKNYRFDVTAPDNRDPNRPTKMLPFQNPPTAERIHTSTLISRNPHAVNFNDEVGGQVDILFVPSDKLTLNLNGSIASRHYDYNSIISPRGVTYERIDRSSSFLPSLKDEFSPFWESFIEAEYIHNDKIQTKLAFGRQMEVTYENETKRSEKIMITTIPLEIKYSINKEYALKLNFEQQWGNNSIRTETSYMNQFVSLNLTRSPSLGVTVSAEFTDDNEEPTGLKSWYIGEVLYKINQSHSISLSYGRERGGLKCTNGICRYVNPFEGFRLMVQNLF